MDTSKEYRDFIIEQLSVLGSVECKPMMGEYLLYYKGVLFGGIYDNILLIKKNDSNKRFGLLEEIPYDGAKSMYMIEDLENQETLQDIILETFNGLKK